LTKKSPRKENPTRGLSFSAFWSNTFDAPKVLNPKCIIGTNKSIPKVAKREVEQVDPKAL
jgi:hypothetical protein